MSEKDLKGLISKLKKVSELKSKLASVRDELRQAVGEVEDILECMDEADLSFEAGLQYFEEGIDKASELV